jgi:hypothetical protein
VAAPVRFYLDEHIPPTVAEGLRDRGIEMWTVKQVEMLGADDVELRSFAQQNNGVFVTHDDDFLRLVSEGHPHSGLVYVPRERTIGEMIRDLRRLTTVFAEAHPTDRVEFL